MPTIGTDCHITLTHADVNSGNPYGFILQTNDRQFGPGVTVQHSVIESASSIKLFFHVLLADDLINPDGSVHADDRSTMYAMLKQFLSKVDGTSLNCPIGSFSDIGATGLVATEYHYTDVSIVVCQVNNVGVYFGPVDYETLVLSVWDGTLTWATSYWR